MKFKDIKTLNHFLKEYGMTAGKPSYGSNATNKMPSVAKPQQNSTKSIAEPKQPNSPTTQGQPEKVLKHAHKFKKDDKVTTKQGELTVVSPVGMNSTSIPNDRDDVIVAVDDQGAPFVFDRNDQLEVSQQLNDGKLSDLAKKGSNKLHLDTKNTKKFKRLIRKNKLREQGEEPIFEINFNKKSLSKEVLDLPIKCGFEAESVWYEHTSLGDGDEEGEWLYDYNWYDIEDFIRDQEGSRSVQRIESAYDEYIEEQALELEGDIIEELVSNRMEDEFYINKYIEEEISEDDIEEYKERILDDLPVEDHDEYEDWDFMNWGRQYVEEELESEYRDWLREEVQDEGETYSMAIDQARDDTSIDDWADNEYGSWRSCLYEFDIYLSDPNGSGDISGVHDDLSRWVSDNSAFPDSDYSSEYHGTGGTKIWRVEPDSSIEDEGSAGAEIISPVYSTPKRMLNEMKKLFDWWNDTGEVGTNGSTGLHITMSYNSENNKDVNPVKLAVLLGDKYLLSTFGRQNNNYTKSQMKRLEKAADTLKSDPNNLKSIDTIEKALMGSISQDKFSSINFKGEKDKETGNKLIEFRIGGGHDYQTDFPKVVKAVVRYSLTLQAAYDPKAYLKDYARALTRLIQSASNISAQDQERVKDRFEVDSPAIDVLKDFFSKENYIQSMQTLASAFNNLKLYKQLSEPDADKKWKQQVEKWKKSNPENSEEEFTEAEGDLILKPHEKSPSKRAPEILEYAQINYVECLAQAGHDFSQNLNRAPANAKAIGTLRKSLSDFELTYEDLDRMLQRIAPRVEARDSADTKTRYSRVKNGIDRLFKKDIFKLPVFLNNPQTEKLIMGMWNAINSGDLQDGNRSAEFCKVIGKLQPSSDSDYADAIARWLDEVLQGSEHREYKQLQSLVLNGKYGVPAILTPGKPVNPDDLKVAFNHLSQYPEWKHPVAKAHNYVANREDDYATNSMNRMMQRLRLRFNHLEDIRQEDPGMYIDSARLIGKALTKLIKTNGAYEAELTKIYPDLEGTIIDTDLHGDGRKFFGMSSYEQERFAEIANSLETGRVDPFGDSPAHNLRDAFQGYLADCLENYYRIKNKNQDKNIYSFKEIQDLIKSRTNSIKEFLNVIDKVSQDIGFDSIKSDIDNKTSFDKRQKEYDKKHGVRHLAVINGFDYGGTIFISKRLANRLSDEADEPINDANLAYSVSMHSGDTLRSKSDDVLVIPDAHYYTALDATEVQNNEIYEGTWRENVAQQILRKFYSYYSTAFSTIKDYYVSISDSQFRISYNGRMRTINDILQMRNIEITDDMGDGRVPNYDPILPLEEILGPFGEPFSPSMAAAWKVNNPELAKKAENMATDSELSDERILRAGYLQTAHSMPADFIANEADYSALAQEFQIAKGVNDQGINLLKNVTTKFATGKMPGVGKNVRKAYEDGMFRFLEGFKLAVKYIRKNYIESGGNYFRKDAEGNPGDDVSAVHGNAPDANLGEIDRVELTDTSYAEARGDYEKFDGMMQNGMQNYMVQPDVNRLVKFLLGDFSESYKRAVLHALIVNKSNGGEPADMQQALALGKQSMESVFDKFDKLPLVEQLSILSRVNKTKIDKAWKKNEGRMKQWAMDTHGDNFLKNPLKPKVQYRPADANRSLRYNPDKHKEAVIQSIMRKQNVSRQQAEKQVAMLVQRDPDYFTAKKQIGESVPDNSTMTKIVKLMKSPILANDLKAQMEAYFAIPDPQMIRAFRDARAQGGDTVDLRGIFKSYLKKLHSSQKQKLNISESRGVTARAQGEEYVNKEDPEDILTVQEIFVTPEDSNQYQTYEDLENALDQIIPQDSVRINDNNPNSGTKAALIAHVTDKNGTPQFWVRFIRAIPPGGVTGLWKTLNGYQFRKGAEQESIPIKPSDLIKDENFKSTQEIEREVMQNLYSQVQDTEYEPLYDIMQKAIDLAKENSDEPIPEAGQYFNVLQKYSGEYLGPIALIDGNSKEGDTQQMLDAYGLETLAGSQVMFPQDTAYALIDSLMKTPDGKEIGVSSKIHTSGGAASSIGGVYKQLTDEIKKKHPRGSKIMEVLATESAINGPIKVCVMLNIISPSDAKELVEFDRASQNVDDIQSPKLKQLTLNQGVAQGTLDRPDYRVFFHALTAVAVKMIEAVNEIQDFKDAILESLNNNNYIQILTKGKKSGEDVSLSYYTKFPATYQGEPKLENKNYFATGQKGRIGFKLKK